MKKYIVLIGIFIILFGISIESYAEYGLFYRFGSYDYKVIEGDEEYDFDVSPDMKGSFELSYDGEVCQKVGSFLKYGLSVEWLKIIGFNSDASTQSEIDTTSYGIFLAIKNYIPVPIDGFYLWVGPGIKFNSTNWKDETLESVNFERTLQTVPVFFDLGIEFMLTYGIYLSMILEYSPFNIVGRVRTENKSDDSVDDVLEPINLGYFTFSLGFLFDI